MELDALGGLTTHLITFFVGAAIGAVGSYYADKSTDQRRQKEAAEAERDQFSSMRKLMPALLDEMAQDLRAEHGPTTREFVILPNARVTFHTAKKRFSYFVDRHPAVVNQVDMLCTAGFVQVVRSTDTPIYRLTEPFVRRLTDQARPEAAG